MPLINPLMSVPQHNENQTWYTDGIRRPALPSAMTSKVKGQGHLVHLTMLAHNSPPLYLCMATSEM